MEIADQVVSKIIPEKYRYTLEIPKRSKKFLLRKFRRDIKKLIGFAAILSVDDIIYTAGFIENIRLPSPPIKPIQNWHTDLFCGEVITALEKINYQESRPIMSTVYEFWSLFKSRFSQRERAVIDDVISAFQKLDAVLLRVCMWQGAISFYNEYIISGSYVGDTLKKYYNMLIS